MATIFNCLASWSESLAIIIPSPEIRLSHSQLLVQVLSFQQKLAGIGLAPGDAVAIAFPNTIEYLIAFLAISFQRSICAPLNPAYKQDEFEFYLEDLDAAIILVPRGYITKDGEAIRAAKKCKTKVAEVYWNGAEVQIQVAQQKDALSDGNIGRVVPIEKPKENDVALILHTSGTTGRPKAVPLTHSNLCRTMANIQATYNLTVLDRTMLVMPLFHVHGLLAGFLAPLLSGGSVIVAPRFSASEFWKDFIQYGANWYTAVPTIHQILLRSPLPSPMPKIRFIRSCSSPLSPTIHTQLEMVMGCPVLEAYAMTEAAHQMTSNPLPPLVRKPGSVGIPQGLELQIMNDAGTPLPSGQIGEVSIKGSNVTSGYLGVGIASPFTASGYFRTGDQGFLDNDGYLILTGRIKELINKGGEKISPIEIDHLFAQHPKVGEAVSFAIDDELYGQNVAVAIALKADQKISVADLLEWFGERAAKFKVPKKVLAILHTSVCH